MDVVLNNMVALGRYGEGIGGSYFDGDFKEYPAVPYFDIDFHSAKDCPNPTTFVSNYNDPGEVRNCSYKGWNDLDQSRANVRSTVSHLGGCFGIGWRDGLVHLAKVF